MSDALTPHGMETGVNPAPRVSAPKRNPLRSLWRLPDRIADGLTRAINGLFSRLAVLLGTLLFPNRRRRPSQLRGLVNDIRERTARFDAVRALSDPDIVAPSLRDALRRRVHIYERKLVRIEYRSKVLSGMPTVILGLALLFYAVLVVFTEGAIARLLRVPISLHDQANVLFLVVHLCAISFFFQLPSQLMRIRRARGFPSGVADVISVLMPAILGLPCLVAAYAPTPLPVRFLLLAIGQAGLFYGAFLALFLPLVVLLETRRAAAPRRAHPDAYVAHEIILALLVLENGQGDLQERAKFILLGLLDAAARSIQDVPRLYRSSDIAMYDWLTERARQWAAALSDLKKWVITPMPDTREHLTRRLASQCAYFVAGTWDGLERKEPEKVSRRRVGRALIAETARICLAAGVPVLALVLIQRSPGRPPRPRPSPSSCSRSSSSSPRSCRNWICTSRQRRACSIW